VEAICHCQSWIILGSIPLQSFFGGGLENDSLEERSQGMPASKLIFRRHHDLDNISVF
jgi:hypothetical protein